MFFLNYTGGETPPFREHAPRVAVGRGDQASILGSAARGRGGDAAADKRARALRAGAEGEADRQGGDRDARARHTEQGAHRRGHRHQALDHHHSEPVG